MATTRTLCKSFYVDSWTGRLSTESEDSSKKAFRVRLLTLNMFMRPPPIKNNEDDFKNERLEYFGQNLLKDFDIVANQEVFTLFNHRKQRLIDFAKQAGLVYSAVGDRPPFYSLLLTDGGLCTTSKYPIVDKKFLPYKYGFGSDSLSFKGVLYTKILV